MFLSMNWISDFVDFTGLDKLKLISQFSLSTAEVENEIFFNVLKCLWENKSQLEGIKCQNRIQKLFGYDLLNKITYNKWNTADAIKFINALVDLWNNWGK